MEKKNNTYSLFASIGKLITSSLELDDILDGIMKEVRLYFSPQNWSLMRYDHTSKSLFFVIVEGINYQRVKHIRMEFGEGIAGNVVKTKKSIFVPDTSKDPRFSDKVDKVTGFKTESIIAVPIIIKDNVYGVIEIINRELSGSYTEKEHLILQTIADFSAIAFENYIAYNRALVKSEIDQLTGLYNYAKLESVIDEYGKETPRQRKDDDTGTNFIVVYIDLDRFKEINDRFSHREGDEVLKRVAMRLKSIFRSEDLIFRTGGDEFIVLLQITGPSDMSAITARIEDILSAIRIKSLKNDYTIKLSFGIKTGPAEKIKELIHEADLSMYEQKKQNNTEEPN